MNLKKIYKEIKLPLVFVFFIFLIRSLVVNYYSIPSGSMYPNLSIGDHIVVNRLSYGTHIPLFENNIIEWDKPKRGDIVVFHSPNGIVMVKRVIGLPGERIKLINDDLYINGVKAEHNPSSDVFNNDPDFPIARLQKLTQESLDGLKYNILTLSNEDIEKNKHIYPKGIDWRNSEIQAKDDEVILIGDNRNNSVDSRFWGALPTKKIIGKVFYKI